MAIKYECDGCSATVEHRGPDLPGGWASIGIVMRVVDLDGEAGNDSSDDQPSLFCRKCVSKEDLWARAVSEIQNMLRPKAR